MIFKQWVFQNFKKNTDMTVEEMLITLNNLGDKLEQHGSTAQFIKPLNLLAGYYKHQLDQLKGLQKVSHKQSGEPRNNKHVDQRRRDFSGSAGQLELEPKKQQKFSLELSRTCLFPKFGSRAHGHRIVSISNNILVYFELPLLAWNFSSASRYSCRTRALLPASLLRLL